MEQGILKVLSRDCIVNGHGSILLRKPNKPPGGDMSVANEEERHIERRRCGILAKGSVCNQRVIE